MSPSNQCKSPSELCFFSLITGLIEVKGTILCLLHLCCPCTLTCWSLHPTVWIFYHGPTILHTFFMLILHAYVSDASATPKLTLTHVPAILLCFAFPHQNPLPTLCPTLHPSLLYLTHLPPLKYPTPCPICLRALCKEVAAISCGAPAPLLPAHAPRHPAREAKAQSLVW